jgi:hypothetical protein
VVKKVFHRSHRESAANFFRKIFLSSSNLDRDACMHEQRQLPRSESRMIRHAGARPRRRSGEKWRCDLRATLEKSIDVTAAAAAGIAANPLCSSFPVLMIKATRQ